MNYSCQGKQAVFRSIFSLSHHYFHKIFSTTTQITQCFQKSSHFSTLNEELLSCGECLHFEKVRSRNYIAVSLADLKGKRLIEGTGSAGTLTSCLHS